MKITIVCSVCSRRHRVERDIVEPGPVNIVCHECEMPLSVDVTAGLLGLPTSRSETARRTVARS